MIGLSRFAGNLITFRCETMDVKRGGETESRTTFYDITLADLRHAFEFMAEHNTIFDADSPNKYYTRAPNEWTKAVKISCSGDMAFMGKQKYREAFVRRSNIIFSGHGRADVSDISKQMGFALRVKEMGIDRSWHDKINPSMHFDPCSNPESIHLLINLDVSNAAGQWGMVPGNWDNGIDQTALVVRNDRKDLTTHQVEALVNYIKDVVVENIGEGGPFGENRSSRQRIVDTFLLSIKFRDFFNNLKQSKVDAGDQSWAEAVFPGDI